MLIFSGKEKINLNFKSIGGMLGYGILNRVANLLWAYSPRPRSGVRSIPDGHRRRDDLFDRYLLFYRTKALRARNCSGRSFIHRRYGTGADIKPVPF